MSPGIPSVFLFGGMKRSDPTRKLRLAHGDVVVWCDPAPLRFHGMLPRVHATHPLTGNCWISRTVHQTQGGLLTLAATGKSLSLDRRQMDSRCPLVAPLHCLMAFAQALHVRRMIEGIALEPRQTFWIMTMNLLIDSASIEWCKVFGRLHDQTHWTHTNAFSANMLAGFGRLHDQTHWTHAFPKDEHDGLR